MADDLYSILGLPRGSSIEDVKKAYKTLARKYHPDVNKESGAEERFKKINEAHQILTDPTKKAHYDQFGSADPSGFSAGGGPFTYTYGNVPPDFDLSDLFGGGSPTGGDTIFDFIFGGGARKGRDIHYSLQISFANAVHGLEQTVQIEGRSHVVKIPPGVWEGSQIKLAGKGGEAPLTRSGKAGPAGDVYLHISIDPKTFPPFHIEGSDIYTTQQISFSQAVLGTTVHVPVIDKKALTGIAEITAKIPAGVKEGQLIRLRGYGMPDVRGKGTGDAYIRVSVVIPSKISKKARELLTALEKEL